ncbi:MAG: diguanylate cyclase [Nitrosomonas sp.]|nr:diguanylate cyclase [Nitrosomonas sp.]
MSKNSNPSIIARETLRQLATLKIPPTPDNYHKLYDEIAGIPANRMCTSTTNMLSELAKEFPRSTPELVSYANKLESSVSEKNWKKYKGILEDLINQAALSINAPSESNKSSAETPGIAWGELIIAIMKQLEKSQGALTIVKKRDGLNRVLAKFSAKPEQLHGKLRSLLDSWVALAAASKESVEIEVADSPALVEKSSENVEVAAIVQSDKSQSTEASIFLDQLKDLLAIILEHIATLHLGDAAFVDEASALARKVRLIDDGSELEQFVASFKQLGVRLNSFGGSSAILQQRLLKLFNQLVDSTEELLAEDKWLQRHIVMLRETMSKQLDLGVIEQAEHYIEEILNKQHEIKSSLGDAKTTLKQMITCLVDNIDDLSKTTGDYHDKMVNYAEKINLAKEIPDLNQLLVEILRETKHMQSRVISTRDEFLAARAEVEIAEGKINQLETELLKMGEKVHEDHLTGILNRRGLDNAFERESARAVRNNKPMCFALLDIDNFKRLNDVHGHHVGDSALVYLVEAVKETTRPHDIVARFGGEEFVILLPDASIEEAVAVISRVRRSLTKRFFLHENKRLLITFSAGVAEYQVNESQDSIVVRADKALYQAKNNGKNQVVIAET